MRPSCFRDTVPSSVWKKDWVVHSKPVDNGEKALKYLAPYIYRVAITNNRLVKLENDQVTFRYKDSDTDQWRLMTLPVMEFIRRFLQHVVPKNFMKIRYYGLLSPTKRRQLEIVRYILGADKRDNKPLPEKPKLFCPTCGSSLRMVKRIPRFSRGPP